MIASLRSRCMTCRHLVEGLGLANDTRHQGSMKGKVEAGRNCLCLGGMYTLSPQSFYLGYPDRS
jgi:hypothetical protein